MFNLKLDHRVEAIKGSVVNRAELLTASGGVEDIRFIQEQIKHIMF